ncbi:MAG: hypothetical protein JNG85_02535 [Spirochaetaceae bacterium]|nr:hypothetical protein [Spirochaetaceae bacterium]
MKRLLAAFLFGSLIFGAAEAQDRRRLLVSLETRGFTASETEAYASSLDAAMARSSRFGAVKRAEAPAGIVEEAGRGGFDLAAVVSLEKLSDTNLRLSWALMGPDGGESVANGGAETALPDARDLVDFFWLDLVDAAERASAVVKIQGRSMLALRGPPGTIVTGIGKERLELPESGELEVGLRAPATYSWKASAPGYASASGVVALFGERVELALELERLRPWALEVGLLNAAFPDLWVSWRFANDRFFLRAGLHQYLGGLSLARESQYYEPSYFVSLRLVQPGLGAGWLLGKPGGALRPYLGVTASARLAFPPLSRLFLDPVAPLCLEPYLGLEWKAAKRVGLFLELGACLYLFGDPLLMAASLAEKDSSRPLYIHGDFGFLEFPSFRFGARLRL